MARKRKANGDWRKERRNSEGSVYEYKGKVYARLQLIGDDGKRKDKKVLAKSKSHARELLNKLKQELKTHGQPVLDTYRMTFRDLSKIYSDVKLIPARYEDGRKVAGLRSSAGMKSFVPTLVEYFGRKHLRAIKHSDLEAFRVKRIETPVRCGTDEKGEPIFRPRRMASVHRELALMRAMLHYAEREGWIVKTPFESGTGLISIANETKRDRILTRAEEKRLLGACTGRREHLRPILIAALDTGMRRGELFKLTWSDVDLTASLIHIRATNTKTQTERRVGVTARLRVELEQLRAKQPPNYDGPIFGILNNVKTAFKSLRHDTQLQDFRFHDARHTAITRMIESGLPAAEVMKISGHTQYSTFSRYVNVNEEAARRGAELLTAYMNQASPKTETVQQSEAVN